MFMLAMIALLEGFTTLGVQIVSMRMAIPVIGSSIILTSVYIGIILLALSLGYFVGGISASKTKKEKIPVILSLYLTLSGIYYYFLTFMMHEQLLTQILKSTGSYIFTLFAVATILFFIPTFLASQTIPFLAELTPSKSKGKAAGYMLFYSTIGSFIGSVGTSIILFQTIGVASTANLIVFIMLFTASLAMLIHSKKRGYIGLGLCLTLGVLFIIIDSTSKKNYFSFDSAYQEISIRTREEGNKQIKVFHTNRSFASGIYVDKLKSPFGYIQEAIRVTELVKPKRILVLGTAGFTYPQIVAQFPYVDEIIAVDIDPSVKRIAEEEFLMQPLSPKIIFKPESARYTINQAIDNGERFDLVFVDAYNGKFIPHELATKEFYAGLRQIVDPKYIISNLILDRGGNSSLSLGISATMESVLGPVYGKDVSGFDSTDKNSIGNIMISGMRHDDKYISRRKGTNIYTDNKGTTDRDLISMRYGQ